MKNVLDLLIDDFHERALPDLMPRHQARGSGIIK
jgi:hypothetical protein